MLLTHLDSYVEEELQEVVERLNNRDIAQDVKVPDRNFQTWCSTRTQEARKVLSLVMIARKQLTTSFA